MALCDVVMLDNRLDAVAESDNDDEHILELTDVVTLSDSDVAVMMLRVSEFVAVLDWESVTLSDVVMLRLLWREHVEVADTADEADADNVASHRHAQPSIASLFACSSFQQPVVAPTVNSVPPHIPTSSSLRTRLFGSPEQKLQNAPSKQTPPL